MAEIRRKALLDSGVKIEGLQQQNASTNDSTAPKKVVYGSRKKKGPAAAPTKAEPVTKVEKKAEVSPPLTEVPDNAVTAENNDVGDDWEVSEDEENAGVKDSWDVSTDEETPDPPKPVAEPAKAPPKGTSLYTIHNSMLNLIFILCS